jgi:hypothetical protein
LSIDIGIIYIYKEIEMDALESELDTTGSECVLYRLCKALGICFKNNLIQYWRELHQVKLSYLFYWSFVLHKSSAKIKIAFL